MELEFEKLSINNGKVATFGLPSGAIILSMQYKDKDTLSFMMSSNCWIPSSMNSSATIGGTKRACDMLQKKLNELLPFDKEFHAKLTSVVGDYSVNNFSELLVEVMNKLNKISDNKLNWSNKKG